MKNDYPGHLFYLWFNNIWLVSLSINCAIQTRIILITDRFNFADCLMVMLQGNGLLHGHENWTSTN